MALEKWQLLELGAVFVEADLSRMATDVSVEHDQRLPDRVTRRPRQVDGVVRFTEGGRRYLRTIEVQKRGAKIGSGELDKFITKADRLGAQRTTIVSEAGFTAPALERLVDHAKMLDAIHMKKLRRRSVPGHLRDLLGIEMIDDEQHRSMGNTSLQPYAYVSIPSGEVWRYVFIASPQVQGTDAVIAVLSEPADALGGARVVVTAFTKPGGQKKVSRVGMNLEYEDGSVSTVEARVNAAFRTDLNRGSRT
ncbi:MAG TPA: hypothetical protein QF624_04890 [Dehalococcoidia bacterium]|nr:hypothetical protein [Dehalococcoidia bacterium]